MRWHRMPLLALALAVLGAGPLGAAEYQTPTSRPVVEVLPPNLAKGPHYTVGDTVAADGYMYHYTVSSEFGPFPVTGTGALRKLAREIWAIGQLRAITGSEAFLAALKDQATKPVQFAKNLVTKELLLVGSFKRDYAGRYGVDPYSSNAVLQEELDKIGKAAAFGSWTASAATLPISGGAGAVISVTGLSQSFNNVLTTEPPPRIRILAEERLTQMKVPADLAKRYLDHPVYTPRHDLLLVQALSKLGAATGRDGYLRAAIAAEDEEEANFFVNTAQIMRGVHETRGKVAAITMIRALPVALLQDGVAVIPFALDHGVWTSNADKLSQHLKTAYRPAGFKGRFEAWVTGTLSPMMRQALTTRGFTVVENVGNKFEIVD